MKVKDFIDKHPEFFKSDNTYDLIILSNISVLIERMLNSELREQIMNYLEKKVEEIREKELLREGEKMGETKTEEKYQLGLAEAQLLGFYHAQRGYSIADLISSMALNQKEWNKLQKGFKLTYLTKEDIKNIQSEVGKNE